MEKKKSGMAVLLVFLLVLLAGVPVRGQELETTALSAVLLDGQSGEVLFEKDPHAPRAPASMTKIMTLLLTFEAIAEGQVRLKDEVVITAGVNNLGSDPGTHV